MLVGAGEAGADEAVVGVEGDGDDAGDSGRLKAPSSVFFTVPFSVAKTTKRWSNSRTGRHEATVSSGSSDSTLAMARPFEVRPSCGRS